MMIHPAGSKPRRDLIQFFEYFHGDNGASLGAHPKAGWIALVASLIDEGCK